MTSLIRLPNAPYIFSGIAVAGLVLFILAITVLMGDAAAVVGARTAELVCFQLAFTPDRVSEILLSFSAAEQGAIGQLLLPGDFTLAWGYGLVLFGLMGLLAMRLPEPWMKAGAIFMWAPLVASALDCIENVFLYSMVQQTIANPDGAVASILPLLASVVAVSKWIALSVVTPAFGIAGIVKGIATDRRIGSWVVYLLLGQVLVSMLLKPIQDIPPCFG